MQRFTMEKIQRAAVILTHTSHKGCNSFIFTYSSFLYNFNPYTPCGVQLNRTWRFYITLLFQPMHPLWGATRAVYGSATGISTPVPLVGVQREKYGVPHFIYLFQPMRPSTGRHCKRERKSVFLSAKILNNFPN